jgi:membrane dipeptidase
MNRRKFLGYCLGAGMSIGFGSLASCVATKVSLAPDEKHQLNGLQIVDAYAHPHQLHNPRRYDTSTPTIDMMKQIGMVASSFSAVGDRVLYTGNSGKPFNDTMNQLKKVKSFEEKKKVILIRKFSDVPLSIGPDNSMGAIMAVEGGDALEGKIENLDRFYEYGVRMITVLHDHNNEIGFNQRSQSDGPLKPFGIKVVEKMNELGMIIDVSYTKSQTLKDIAKISAAPVVDSHTSPDPLDRPSSTSRLRNWNDMELVAKTGGIVCTWPLAYKDRSHQRTTLLDWAGEIVKMKQRLSIEHVGLGTDGGGNLSHKVNGWESILSLPKLIKAMEEAGLSQNEIAACTGENFLRVLNRCVG